MLTALPGLLSVSLSKQKLPMRSRLWPDYFTTANFPAGLVSTAALLSNAVRPCMTPLCLFTSAAARWLRLLPPRTPPL